MCQDIPDDTPPKWELPRATAPDVLPDLEKMSAGTLADWVQARVTADIAVDAITPAAT